jgi:hypothetical protein
MVLNINDIKEAPPPTAPMILVYGVEGLGKTSLALDFPDPVYLQIAPEAPPRHLRPKGFGVLRTYDDVMGALRALYKEPHSYQTVVIDSLTALEPLLMQDVCIRNKWKDIEAPGFGKGYVAAEAAWRSFMKGCAALCAGRNLTVVLIGLAEAGEHTEPGMAGYKKYNLRLHKRAVGIVTQTPDAVLFLNTKVTVKETDTGFGKKDGHAVGGGTRWLFCDGRPAFNAKNRFNLPEAIMLDDVHPYAALASYFATEDSPGQGNPGPLTNGLELSIPDDPLLIVNEPTSQVEHSKALGGDTLGGMA